MFDSLVEKSFVPGSLNISWIKGAIPQDSKKGDATQLITGRESVKCLPLRSLESSSWSLAVQR
jgi:hypothetical protein